MLGLETLATEVEGAKAEATLAVRARAARVRRGAMVLIVVGLWVKGERLSHSKAWLKHIHVGDVTANFINSYIKCCLDILNLADRIESHISMCVSVSTVIIVASQQKSGLKILAGRVSYFVGRAIL